MSDWSQPTVRLNKLLRTGQIIKVEKNEVIRTSEKSGQFYLLRKGYAKRYLITNEGGIDVQSFYGPGYFMPLITVFRGLYNQEIYEGPETYYYEAMTDSELYHVNIRQVKEAADKDPLVYRELLMIAGRRIEANIQQIENRALRTFYNRVAHQIAFFAEVFSERHGNKARLKIPLTQQDLADILSTTRETVSLCVSDLKKKGIITSGKFIFVNDIERLQKEAFEAS